MSKDHYESVQHEEEKEESSHNEEEESEKDVSMEPLDYGSFH